MRIFVSEYVTGGGLLDSDFEQSMGRLLTEGQAMIAAVAEDLGRIRGTEVVLLRDVRLPVCHFEETCRVVRVSTAKEELSCFSHESHSADYTLIIAPEMDGILLDRVNLAVDSGASLVSPGPEFVRLASDKHSLATYLGERGIPVPCGVVVQPGDKPPEWLTPVCVVKPLDGAGAEGVIRLGGDTIPIFDVAKRCEEFCPGLSVSCSVLCGEGKPTLLPPCSQRFEGQGIFRYVGGELITDESLVRRAHRLVRAACECMPDTSGYVGFDIILGPSGDGSQDRIIELNPRLTTSYVGLRAATLGNLAHAMLSQALDAPVNVSFTQHSLTFDTEGNVQRSMRL